MHSHTLGGDNCQPYAAVPRERSLDIHSYTVKMNPFPPQGGSLGSRPANRKPGHRIRICLYHPDILCPASREHRGIVIIFLFTTVWWSSEKETPEAPSFSFFLFCFGYQRGLLSPTLEIASELIREEGTSRYDICSRVV